MFKKLLAGMMVAAVALTAVPAVSYAATSPSSSVEVEAGKTEEVSQPNGIKPTVTTTAKGNVVVSEIAKTTKTTIVISAAVKVDGVTCVVKRLEGDIFANCTNVKKVSLPATINQIAEKTFSSVQPTATITLASKTAPKINRAAFAGVDTKKMKITTSNMTKKQITVLAKRLKNAGFKGKVNGKTIDQLLKK